MSILYDIALPKQRMNHNTCWLLSASIIIATNKKNQQSEYNKVITKLCAHPRHRELSLPGQLNYNMMAGCPPNLLFDVYNFLGFKKLPNSDTITEELSISSESCYLITIENLLRQYGPILLFMPACGAGAIHAQVLVGIKESKREGNVLYIADTMDNNCKYKKVDFQDFKENWIYMAHRNPQKFQWWYYPKSFLKIWSLKKL